MWEITEYINSTFGPTLLEEQLEKDYSSDKRVRRLLDTISILRFLVFPIVLLLYCIGFVLSVVVLLLNFTIDLVENWFSGLNNSYWLSVCWFGISKEEFHSIGETINVKLKNEQ